MFSAVGKDYQPQRKRVAELSAEMNIGQNDEWIATQGTKPPAL